MYDLTDAQIFMNDALNLGSALLSGRSYQAGQVIARFEAPLVEQFDDTVQFEVDQRVKMDVLVHLNHSCNPNTVIDTTAGTVTAVREIEAGEVLSYEHAATSWKSNRPFVCQCGAADCFLKLVAGARELSPEPLVQTPVNANIIYAINALVSGSAQHRLNATTAVAPAPAPADAFAEKLHLHVTFPMSKAA